MFTSLLFSLILSTSTTTPVHAQSSAAMPVGAWVRDRSAPRPGDEVREYCYRGQITGSNIRQDVCRPATAKRLPQRAIRP